MPEIDEDPSASTARFQAFAQRMDREAASAHERRSPGGRVILIVLAVVCVAIVVGILATTM